jgi:S1-C subfamily serine protease
MPEKASFQLFSEVMADAAQKTGEAIVLVDARRRHPSSGVAFANDLVLTADHTIEREEDINVQLPNGSQVLAKVAGRDPGSDLAVLRLAQSLASPAQPAQGEGRIGQLVLALARPTPDGLQASLGVISAVGGRVRTGRGGLLERYLRSDAAPLPGFSGGALIDADGLILGINTSGFGGGMLLTVPAPVAWQTADILAKQGRIRRGYLGVRSQPVDLPAAARTTLGHEQTSGLLLVGVDEGGPAARSGLMMGDILVAIRNAPIQDPDDLLFELAGLAGQTEAMQVIRAGQVLTLNVAVGERPA